MSNSDGSIRGDAGNDQQHFQPTATLEVLQFRAKLLRKMRAVFEEHGYWEVETPILSHDVVVDAYLEPFVTRWLPDPTTEIDADDGESPRELYLQTSPEFAMKRLLAAGATAIYQTTRAFRNGDVGRYHNPEFTMVEWYRVGDTHREQMRFVEILVSEVFRNAAKLLPSSPDVKRRLDQFLQPFGKLSYDEAFTLHAGTPVLELSAGQLADLTQSRGVVVPASQSADDRDGWLNLLFSELVAPQLGRNRPEFLYDYPTSQAALATVRAGSPPVAERFELFFEGVEICNGYHELTDPGELRERNRRQSALRRERGARLLPESSYLLDAMKLGLPACAGVALGFDRLVMLAIGADQLSEVIAFPFPRA